MPQPRDRNEAVLRARALRRNMTLPEGLLWQALRTRPDGFKFRNQHPIGPFIVDFYCAAMKLVIEVDGQVHMMADRPERDEKRDAWLVEQGLRVLRFGAVDVMRDRQAVIAAIVAACRQ